jgi:carbonic anhydrase/acetyltransferase-like protein (isoleucine patch superfamily)
MPLYSLDGIAPQVPASGRYWVAPDAHVIGNVVLEEDVSVWFGTTIRGDNERIVIGTGSNVQEGCMLHTDPGFPLTIGPRCTIGHHVILHGCTIAEESLIGMGATVLNGAKIARNSLVGAKALVTEGKEFPERSLIVGAPARVARPLEEAQLVRMQVTAAHYVHNWQRYARGFQRIES